ncbi:hypothetical protein [Psychroserpens luteolus]|uniref:hypothetical protein n=1 Tax=Psychroserpens luteolus TaxID=2855840 RepID=UPI001E5B6B14|nr:hypothetical protein [Psychroserpens luteolus]MCD2260101.1 hypothetical protein [Psychroserpens luteolus]
MNYKHILDKNPILWAIFFIVFLSVVSNDAIYSPDTRSYINALPYRHLGYVIFLKVFKLIFNGFFDISVIIFQTVFTLTSIHVFYKKICKLLHFNTIIKFVFLAILLFPLFKPLSVANNICPEGISYGLYLLFIAYSLDLFFNENRKKWIAFILLYFALTFTRGQFILIPLIVVFVYFFKNKNKLLKRSLIFKSLVLICIPVVLVLIESTYHKLKDGIFMTTPFGFVAASGSAFYVSESHNINDMQSDNDRAIFELCYTKLNQEKLLLSSRDSLQSYSEHYKYYHDNLPDICNRTIHYLGKNFYYEKELQKEKNSKLAHAKAYYNIEKSCRNITLILIKSNFKKWINIYYANISHGFYSSFLFIMVVLIFLFSIVKFLFNPSDKRLTLLLFLSALTLSNAMLIAFASHSIIRYLFYNYVLIFIIGVLLIKLLRHGIKN